LNAATIATKTAKQTDGETIEAAPAALLPTVPVVDPPPVVVLLPPVVVLLPPVVVLLPEVDLLPLVDLRPLVDLLPEVLLLPVVVSRLPVVESVLLEGQDENLQSSQEPSIGPFELPDSQFPEDSQKPQESSPTQPLQSPSDASQVKEQSPKNQSEQLLGFPPGPSSSPAKQVSSSSHQPHSSCSTQLEHSSNVRQSVPWEVVNTNRVASSKKNKRLFIFR